MAAAFAGATEQRMWRGTGRRMCVAATWLRTAALLASAAAILSVADAAVAKKAFGVRASVQSGWVGTPLAAQSLEWLRDVDVGQAVSFLWWLTVGEGSYTDAGSQAMEGRLQSSSVRTFHELVVRNSYYSPRIEMLRSLERRDRLQYAVSCAPGAAWALVWHDLRAAPSAACDAAALHKELNGPKSDVSGEGAFVSSSIDLVLQRGSGQGSSVVVIYGAVSALGVKSLAKLLPEVTATESSLKWRCVFRHADGPSGPEGLGADYLTGYGFELAIKSSEYKTHADESKKEGEEAEGASTEGEDGDESDEDLQKETEKELDGPLELDGLLFHVLLKRQPRLRTRLWAFKEQLEAERDTDAVLKAWEIKDIGLQATARIKSSATPLLSLMWTSQNFPAQVAGLARVTVPDSLRKSLNKLRQVVREHSEVFSLNGALVRPDHSDLSLFPMLKSLLPYFVGIERLVRIGLPETLACELLKSVHKSELTPERLDWRSPHLPDYLYHVQKDKKSQRWGDSLQHLLYAFPGGLAPVRLALYTTVYIFDPAEVSDLMAGVAILQQTPLPMSLHMVLVPGGGLRSVGWDEEALGTPPAWISGAGDAASGRSANRASSLMTACYGLALEVSAKRARLFLKHLLEWAKDNLGEEARPRWPDDARGVSAIKKICTEDLKDTLGDDSWDQIVRGVGPSASFVADSVQYITSLGVPAPCMLVNGKLLLKGAYEGQMLFQTIGMEQQILQRALYMGQLTESDGVEEYLASQGFISAYHQDITPEIGQRGGEQGMPGQTTTEVIYLQWPAEAFLSTPFLESIEPEVERPSDEDTVPGALGLFHLTVLSRLSHSYLLQTFASHLLAPDREVLTKNKRMAVPPLVSHWSVLVDPSSASSEEGAMTELAACVRGVLRFKTGTTEINKQKLLVLKFLGTALPAAIHATASVEMTGQHVRELCELAISKKIDPQHQSDIRAFASAATSGKPDKAEADLLAAASAGETAMSEGAALWVCNGRRIALEADGQAVSPRHVQALELLEAQYDVSEVASDEGESSEEDGMMGMMAMFGGGPPPKAPAPPPVKALYELLAAVTAGNQTEQKTIPVKAHGLVAAVRSEALSSQRNERFEQPRQIFEATPAAFRLQIPPARPEAASPITVYGIVDPLSTTAQSASAVLALFGMTFNAEVNLVLNPQGRLSEYPLKRYYREVIRWPDRLADGRAVSELDGEVGGLSASVALATQHTLTAAVHALPTWLVTAYEALHDMDNLRQVDIGDGKWCETTYMLRQLYVEGQAFILGEDGWPIASAKGLQIDVAGKGGPAAAVMDDTIVMGNLGYFQMHGNPGLYEVRLKAGLSNDTFVLAKEKDVEVSSYITPPYQLRVQVRPGRSPEDLMEQGGRAGEASGNDDGTLSRIMGGLKSMWGGQGSDKSDGQEVAIKGSDGEVLPTIHIFSVASGHLYEKLIGIMIMSVMNKTKCPLHFWFIDNFLSPKFKAFIPHMARRYKFDFDFVTYKWPSWLNPQSEKQRLIWAYKVLFLDVLFPLDVPKVIFIDADQVVRADVRELWDMDLKGKVYGFVPMGDTNPETEGFRFWKQGYWKGHLGDLPYHISALYVVDLNEFRRTSIGDQLRGVYNQLSRDPNSLSNLEQDLINFAQHQVPIFSLPADWLWCETWCSQESKKTAKTIDLCQNPLTKEPKIVMARRIISEWGAYHDEVQAFQETVRLSLLADSNVLPASAPAASGSAHGKVEL